ncbi:MAG: molybdopterin-dependent oxidoreductase [Rhodospirillales bacterium]|nr:molybdopterin-dependent oxidoreductase [Rhodospirillales bacterium]
MPAVLEKPSVCPLDCPDTCSLSVGVEDGRIVSVKGSNANPYTAGAICSKVSTSYPDFVHGDGRLTEPLRRVGRKGSGEFEPVSWEQAIDLIHDGIATAIEKHGAQSVLPFNYAGPHGEIAGGSMDRRFFHKLGASLLNRGPLCGGVRGTAYTSLYGSAPGMAPEQAQHADLIVVWGNNVTVSNLHLARVIKSARSKGAKLIVIDPKRTKIAEQADLYIQIQPGTDVVLAQALAAELEKRGALDNDFIDRWVAGFDLYMGEARQYDIDKMTAITGVDEETFSTFADWYENADKVAVSVGNGIERGASGGAGLRAAMALQALTGNHGSEGAGVFAKPGLAIPKTTAKLQRPDLVPAHTRTINIVDVGKLILDENLNPQIAAVFIYNHNPVATHPDQNRMRRALSRDDLFVCGADVVMTDSLLYCDVILPAASHFEFDDIYGAYGTSYLQRAEPVIPCVGQSKPNTEIFRLLAKRFGFDDPIFMDDDKKLMDDAIDHTDPRLKGIKPSEIPLNRAFDMSIDGDTPKVMCKTVFPQTESGKIELFSQNLEDRWGAGIPKFKPVEKSHSFTVITPSSSKRTNATFGNCAPSDGMEVVEIHPDDAERLGIEEGARVRLFNALGQVTLIAKISDAVKPGVLYSPKGTWLKSSGTGQTVNALIPSDIRADIEDGAVYNETFVEIEAA